MASVSTTLGPPQELMRNQQVLEKARQATVLKSSPSPLLPSRKPCVTDTSRPCRGSWSCWNACVERYTKRGTT